MTVPLGWTSCRVGSATILSRTRQLAKPITYIKTWTCKLQRLSIMQKQDIRVPHAMPNGASQREVLNFRFSSQKYQTITLEVIAETSCPLGESVSSQIFLQRNLYCGCWDKFYVYWLNLHWNTVCSFDLALQSQTMAPSHFIYGSDMLPTIPIYCNNCACRKYSDRLLSKNRIQHISEETQSTYRYVLCQIKLNLNLLKLVRFWCCDVAHKVSIHEFHDIWQDKLPSCQILLISSALPCAYKKRTSDCVLVMALHKNQLEEMGRRGQTLPHTEKLPFHSEWSSRLKKNSLVPCRILP